MWALIIDCVVAEITTIDPAGRYPASMLWQPCGSEVQAGWTWNSGKFSPPAPEPGPTAEELEASFNAGVSAKLNAFAVQRQYDSIQNAILAKNTTKFKHDGTIAAKAYDETWEAAILLAPQVVAGNISVDDALAKLPPLNWPEG